MPKLKSIFFVGFYSGFGVAASFARGVILARVLGADQFGLAVILISILAALDMFADAGIDRFVVSNRFGYRADVMRTSHAYRVFGSALVGIAIMLIAYPLALLFNSPAIWPAIAAMGGVIILRGFVNLEYKVEQRSDRFTAETRIDVTRFTVELLVLAGIAFATRSYWAVVAGAYANVLIQLLISHSGKTMRYSFLPRRRVIKLVARFSTPIYINATLLLAAVQGDRLVIAASFTSRELAFYAVACALGQGGVSVLSKVIMNLFLPSFSPAAGTRDILARRVNRIGWLVIALAVLFVAVLTLAGPRLVTFIYGPEYTGLRALIFASAIVQMIQIEQSWLTTLLMAQGLTRDFPRITVMRAAAFPVAILFAHLQLDILAIPFAFAIGAALSLAQSYLCAAPLKLVDRRLAVASFIRIACSLAIIAALIIY